MLVRSVRVNGQPRQKTVGYLASIRDFPYIIEHPQYRYNFWVSLREHLDNLQRYGEIDADTRQSVEDRIARTVRRASRVARSWLACAPKFIALHRSSDAAKHLT